MGVAKVANNWRARHSQVCSIENRIYIIIIIIMVRAKFYSYNP